MSITITISVSDFNDAITLEKWAFVTANVECARKVVEAGGKIVFEQRFINAPPQVLRTISSREEFDQWKACVCKVIAQIKTMNKPTT